MDKSLPSYEAAMREARAYLRRRDLSSQDEIPLYFAWQRLYAAANANLSTDFLRETTSELRARQDARLEPRRGIPPPLFTSFDKVNRTSAQASAFLRTGTSSQAAIEMMARRYRRDAEKLRLSREKSMGFTRKSIKKVKMRQKTPQEEVDELLESLEGSERLSDDEDLLAKTKRGNRQQRRHATFEDEDVDSLDSLGNPQISTKHASTVRNKLDAGGIGVAVNPAKAAELRRSSSAVAPLGNVAAFAAQVDWRMPPDIDRASSAPELSQKGSGKRLSGVNELRGPGLLQKGASLKSTVSGGRLSGGNELREPGLADEEGDRTLNSSVDEDNFDPSATFNVDAARVSPTANRSIGKNKRNFSSNQASDERGEMTRAGRERPIQSHAVGSGMATISEFQQKLVQLSRAVGDMEVKIQGKKIKVTFQGELNEEDSAKAVASSIKAGETNQPSPHQKTFDATGRASVKGVEQETNVKNGTQGRDQAQRTNVGHTEETSSKDLSQDKAQTNVPRKQSNVRFADTARSDDYKEDRDETTGSHQQQKRGESGANPSVQAADQPRQLRSSASGSAFNSNAAAEAVLVEESDEETKEEKPTGQPVQEGEQVHETGSDDGFGSHNLQQQTDKERQQERSDEENEDSGVTEHGKVHGERPDSRRGSQRGRGVDTEYQDARTDRSRSGTQKSSRDSFGSHKLQHQMRQGMDEDRGSIGEQQESHSTSQRDRGTTVALQDVQTDRSKSAGQQFRPQSRNSERDPTNEQDVRSINELDKAKVDQNARPNRDQLEKPSNAARAQKLSSTERVSHPEVEFERSQRNDSARELSSSTLGRGSQQKVGLERSQRSDSALERNLNATERSAQQNVEFDQQSFSDASEDESDGRTSYEKEENSDRGSFSEDQRSRSHSGSSSRASSVPESVREDRERLQTPRPSHNQSEEVSDSSVPSDEEFSDGPDTPFKQHKHHRTSPRQVSKPQHEKLEKRRSSSRRKKYVAEFSGNSEISTSRDNSSSDEIYRSRSHHSTRSPDRAQSRYSSRKSSRHLPPAMVSHPRRSKDHTKSESKSRKTTWKLPKGIVWPPGMEEECVARLGLDGHHPIAPPGLEHLVTEEQWGEYWTWLHWYSSWQMWYMKNDKKPKKKTDKDKRRRRDDSPDNRRSSNWWVDAGSSKVRHRRERHD
ncbi:hypothetical protein DVH05_026043 [Phytophthora capsici]|nr:hypothetical protein DVH05_026043 [Phytophthora capsici]